MACVFILFFHHLQMSTCQLNWFRFYVSKSKKNTNSNNADDFPQSETVWGERMRRLEAVESWGGKRRGVKPRSERCCGSHRRSPAPSVSKLKTTQVSEPQSHSCSCTVAAERLQSHWNLNFTFLNHDTYLSVCVCSFTTGLLSTGQCRRWVLSLVSAAVIISWCCCCRHTFNSIR